LAHTTRPHISTEWAGDYTENNDYNNVYAIPANYTDSGKLFGGMLETRNTVETVLLLALLGYPELFWMTLPAMMRIVVMVLTLIPVSVVSLMGIDGDSLFQYLGHIIRFFINRRRLHFRRIGYHYDPKRLKTHKKAKRKKKQRTA
jgi:hypothetical protein